MTTLKLTGSIGTGKSKKGIPHNDPSDFLKVRDRFVQLGFNWVQSKTTPDKEFIKLIKLFQSICKGNRRVEGGDGRIDLHGNTHRWLAAKNAPGWVNMENKRGFGYRCVKVDYENSYATTWMRDSLVRAGIYYSAITLLNPSPPMWVRDFSRYKGGKTKGHGSHQTGLNVDMRLPVKDSIKYDKHLHFKHGVNDKKYKKLFDRESAKAQLKAIKVCMTNNKKSKILFNDPELRKAHLCNHYKNHGGHYHISILPPARSDGIYK